MGLSSSKTRTTASQNSRRNETMSGTQMPVTPDWLLEDARDYVNRIGAFADIDPNDFVAPASPLQRLAWDHAGALGGWQGQARKAAELLQGLAGQGANRARAAGDTGRPSGAAAQGYSPAQVAHPTIDPTDNASAVQAPGTNIAERIGAYQNPFRQQVVDTSLADFDQGVDRQRARLAAQGARSGAFGGSRFGIAEGQLAADAARGRGSLAAGLRAQGFDTAAGLAADDAARADEMARFNAGSATHVSLANADRLAQRAAAQAGMALQAGLANQNAANAAASQRSVAENAASLFNADLFGRLAMFDAGQEDAAANRALQAAQWLQAGASDQGAGTRADLQALASLGDQQRNIAQAFALAPLAQLQAMGQLSGMTPYDILVGRAIDGTTSGTTSGSGTQVTRSSPSLFTQLLAAGNLAF